MKKHEINIKIKHEINGVLMKKFQSSEENLQQSLSKKIRL